MTNRLMAQGFVMMFVSALLLTFYVYGYLEHVGDSNRSVSIVHQQIFGFE